MNARRLFRVLGLMVLVGLAVVPAGAAQSRSGAESDPIKASFQAAESTVALVWNTFLGGSGWDEGNDIAIDASGNMYVTGTSDASWGTPLRPFAGGYREAFVAKLNPSGVLVWNTFLGSSEWDEGNSVLVDVSGNIYVTGRSDASWGTPVNPHAGNADVFLSKLNPSGALLWNTFLSGNETYDTGYGIAADGSGNIYVTGETWEGLWYAFVAKLDSSGVLVWNTTLGLNTTGSSIAVDSRGNSYVTGYSEMGWGTPLNPFAGERDAFVASLDSSGALIWNTFLGGSYDDSGNKIAVDGSGNLFVAGISTTSWGTPIKPFGRYGRAFVARLDGSGALLWNTFLGSGLGIAVDGGGDIYITGGSGCWGLGINAFASDEDASVAALDGNGTLRWNTFLGGSDLDYGNDIAVDGNGNLYVSGTGWTNWGTPLRPYAGVSDAFVAKLDTQPGVLRGHACGQTEDGWVLESSETSGQGGTVNGFRLTLTVGDDAEDRQYRAILSFDTSALPENAMINKVTLKIKRFGLVGTNPFSTHGGLKVDIRSPNFGPAVALEARDFQAAASKPAVATIYQSTRTADGWYWTSLSADAFPYINRTGTTQFRLRFWKDDNDDMGADYLNFISTNSRSSDKYYGYVPRLIIEYTVP